MPVLKIRFFGRRRDAGGVAVIVGILLATGVLLGVSALAVDVGQIYAEREELQSGADAAAMAVAMDCLHGRETDCRDLHDVTAKHYANLNARDGVSNVAEVCGVDRDWLSACSGGPDNLTACLGDLPLNTSGWVQVRVTTERPSGSDDSRFILPSIFAQTLASGVRGTSVGACSRVAWGTPPQTFAFTVCEKIFNDYTGNGTDLAPPPPARPSLRYEHFFFKRPGVTPYTGPCDDTSAAAGSWPLDSDFGWEDLDFSPVNCDVDMSHPSDAKQLLPHEPPATPTECFDALVQARATGQPIPVLVVKPNDDDATLVDVVGVAAFVVTGYRIEHQPDARSTMRRHRRCGRDPSVTCVSGYFTTMINTDEQVRPNEPSQYGMFGGAPTSLGASVVQTVG
jgi:Flp pilus assembly protein TadG